MEIISLCNELNVIKDDYVMMLKFCDAKKFLEWKQIKKKINLKNLKSYPKTLLKKIHTIKSQIEFLNRKIFFIHSPFPTSINHEYGNQSRLVMSQEKRYLCGQYQVKDDRWVLYWIQKWSDHCR